MRHGVNAGITYAPLFEEYSACIAAGLDLWQWEQGIYPPDFKARVIVWNRLHGLIQIHSEDAALSAAQSHK